MKKKSIKEEIIPILEEKKENNFEKITKI